MRFLAICLMLLCPVLSSAQDVRKVNCRFVCCGGTAPPPPLINAFDKDIEVTCTIPTNTFSEPVECCAKSNVISFLSSERRKPMASAKIPEQVKAAILVFIPAGKSSDTAPWRVFVIEDTIKNFPDGGAFVANLCTQDVRFSIGEKTIILKSGTDHGFARPATRDAFNMAPVIFQFQKNDEWRTISETLLRFVPGMRHLIFAYLDPSPDRPRIITFQDFLPVPIIPPLHKKKLEPQPNEAR